MKLQVVFPTMEYLDFQPVLWQNNWQLFKEKLQYYNQKHQNRFRPFSEEYNCFLCKKQWDTKEKFIAHVLYDRDNPPRKLHEPCHSINIATFLKERKTV